MSNHAETSIEWYVNWLAENRPDIAPDQRLELATGFVAQQQPLVRPDDAAEDQDVIDEDTLREATRAEERKNRKYLTGDELMKILATPGEVKAAQ